MMEGNNALQIREIMTRDVVTVNEDLTLDQAAILMRDEKIGCVVVVRTDTDAPVGIVTERDILVKAVAKDRAPDSMTVGEIMTTPLFTIKPDTDVLEAARQMASMRIRRMPVVEGETLVGIITENDILNESPTLIEKTREVVHERKVNRADFEPQDFYAGECDNCHRYAQTLLQINGQLLCDYCRELQGTSE